MPHPQNNSTTFALQCRAPGSPDWIVRPGAQGPSPALAQPVPASPGRGNLAAWRA
ncbi:hypothetical protein GQ53DRAFT_754424 [Thozetella sp. PMI_491]|nr:hypothetical protein GQ53DRAFT_754424 [Thozetella sp. PMI_491]